MKKEGLGQTAAIIGFAILFFYTVSAWDGVGHRLDRMESRMDELDEAALQTGLVLDQLCQITNPEAVPQLNLDDPCEMRAYVRALVDSVLVSDGAEAAR
ncbi:hypothetical protein [Candidatus Palauibacter polyketidifaciens]|uniref:hypothetical protein n=1 Tax=Candidatus Palauibacter polyketidifaciens TaxID=3056740 RepID=UPI0023A41516|nr:hypothetical protein [Candidatus Palauibacter polyketidifaciens]MDE2720476.1 hypothetical protein [Candidatus Palauibacter polyketidifaciens]